MTNAVPAPVTVAIISLDSSHAVEFVRRMQAADCPEENRVPGLRAKTFLRFPSAYQREDGQDKRQAQLEAWGVVKAPDLAAAVAGVDGIMMIINDPAPHREWFERIADFGKPVFIDKPLASSIADAVAIATMAKQRGLRVSSASSLRSDAPLRHACAEIPHPTSVSVYGHVGVAPAGSSLVWYGVHSVEMLERAMGRGAVAVSARRDAEGVVAVVDYADRRRGVVELSASGYLYGGTLRDSSKAVSFAVDSNSCYSAQLREVERFFRGGEGPATLDSALEVTAILDAIERSYQTGGATQAVYQ